MSVPSHPGAPHLIIEAPSMMTINFAQINSSISTMGAGGIVHSILPPSQVTSGVDQLHSGDSLQTNLHCRIPGAESSLLASNSSKMESLYVFFDFNISSYIIGQ